MDAGIYKIRNVNTNDIYVGQSIKLMRRKRVHWNKLKKDKHDNIYLQRAWNKYGENNFIFEILLYCEEFELDRYEQELVNKLKPAYNLCKECVTSCKGKRVREEVKIKISMSHIGRKRGLHTEESKKKMSESHRGIVFSIKHIEKLKSARKNRIFSEETRKKMSLSQTGKKHSFESIRKSVEGHKKKTMTNFKSYLTSYNLLTDSIDLTKLNQIVDDILNTYPLRGNNKVFVCGNGGSFATAQHFAQDLCKIVGIDAECLGSNPSQLTAYANDNGYSYALVNELDNKVVRACDLLVIISVSGNSKNLIRVADSISALNNNFVIGLLGSNGGKIVGYCKDYIIVPSKRYDFVESVHSLLCHYIVNEIRERLDESV